MAAATATAAGDISSKARGDKTMAGRSEKIHNVPQAERDSFRLDDHQLQR